MTERLREDYINGERAIVERWPWLIAIKWMFDKVGMPAILIIFMLGAWSGVIETPLTDITATLVQHTQQTERLIDLLEINRELATDWGRKD
jgi:hypothetical protein